MRELLRHHKFYALTVLLAFGLYAWASLNGRRLLGDDNEITENINGSGGTRAGGHGGRSLYFHK
ncbi:hypothetical protein LJ737_25015 [Hymenobacter sp. 15J16-1T3B]|uniref:hypothetical protein n=1 Tax=Hymenobacter sp. 15J16-1T3B TaxID=2886941 RepID=UPI001D128661|nr:hypothetical protein [Hymenobacter sp. 15J16-1T3B]MCC3160522.1 hypothetical protein [Hymenobacter sp. 15J16-1T3B]